MDTPQFTRRSVLETAGTCVGVSAAVRSTTASGMAGGHWASWYGDNRNTGSANVETPTSLEIGWQHTFDEEIRGFPILFDNELYVPVGTDLVAFDLDRRTVRWQSPLGDQLTSRLAVTAETVVAASTLNEGSYKIRAFDRTDGTEQWQTPSETSIRCAPAVGGNAVYIADDKGRVRALDLQTGDIQWTSPGPEHPIYFGPPTLTESSVFVKSHAGIVRAIDRSDGTRNWSVELEAMGIATPVAGSEAVYIVGGWNEYSTVAALDQVDGTRRWERSIEGNIFLNGALNSDYLFADVDTTRKRRGRLIALDRETGETVWEAPTPREPGFVIVTESAVYVMNTTTMQIHRLTDGTKLGDFTLPSERQGLPIVRPNEILQATEGGSLLSLQAPGGITDDLLPIGGGTVGVLGALALGYRYWNRDSSD